MVSRDSAGNILTRVTETWPAAQHRLSEFQTSRRRNHLVVCLASSICLSRSIIRAGLQGGTPMPLHLGPGPVFVHESIAATRRWQLYLVRSLFVFGLLASLS